MRYKQNMGYKKYSTPSVQEEHTKGEVVHLTPGLLDLGVLFNIHA